MIFSLPMLEKIINMPERGRPYLKTEKITINPKMKGSSSYKGDHFTHLEEVVEPPQPTMEQAIAAVNHGREILAKAAENRRKKSGHGFTRGRLPVVISYTPRLSGDYTLASPRKIEKEMRVAQANLAASNRYSRETGRPNIRRLYKADGPPQPDAQEAEKIFNQAVRSMEAYDEEQRWTRRGGVMVPDEDELL